MSLRCCDGGTILKLLSQFESIFHQLVSFGRRRTGLTEAGSRWKGREESCAPSVSSCHPQASRWIFNLVSFVPLPAPSQNVSLLHLSGASRISRRLISTARLRNRYAPLSFYPRVCFISAPACTLPLIDHSIIRPSHLQATWSSSYKSV